LFETMTRFSSDLTIINSLSNADRIDCAAIASNNGA
jgi:hypothetical protein